LYLVNWPICCRSNQDGRRRLKMKVQRVKKKKMKGWLKMSTLSC